MGRDYYGMLNGRIPKFITDENIFTELCCKNEGYLRRFETCGCCVYEFDDHNIPILQTECHLGYTHKTIIRDEDFIRWSCDRNMIIPITEKIRIIELFIPVNNYVYLDQDYEICFRNQDDLDNLSYETNTQIFHWIILTELIVAFDMYLLHDKIIFTSET